jgi:[acyl-carrier-protein] S-malonyltransferase
MQEAVPEGEGTMAAILGMELKELEELCDEVGGQVVPANLNCPGQIVVSGERAAVEDVVELSRERGAKRAVVLDVSGPFHSPLMEPASKRLEVALEAVTIGGLAVPLVNNVSARLVRSADEVREGLVQQLTSAVRWEGVVRELMAQGVDSFIELGPGRVLNGLIRRIRRDARVFNLEDAEGLGKIKGAAAGGEV